MSSNSTDYSKRFSYKVPVLEGHNLNTQHSVWDLIETKASELIVIPDNIDEIREHHEKKLDKLI